MDESLKSKLFSFVKLVTNRFRNKENALNLSALCAADYINYLIAKGTIYESEKEKICDYVLYSILLELNIIVDEYKDNVAFNNSINWLSKHNKNLMMQRISYDYETLSFFLKQLN